MPDGARAGSAAPSAAAPRRTPAAGRRPLPDAVRSRMEASFGADFSGVTVGENDEPARVAAIAFTGDEGISFSPGQYDPHSSQGLAVIGHELAHVVQQRAGRVRGSGVAEDPALEAEADDAGVRAARGEPVTGEEPGVGPAPEVASPPATGVVQPKGGDKIRSLQQKLMGQAGPPAPVNQPAPPRRPARGDIYGNAPPGQAAPPPAQQVVQRPVAPQVAPQVAQQPAPPPVAPVADYREAFVSLFDEALQGELRWAIDRMEGILARQVGSGVWSAEAADAVRGRFQGRLDGIAKRAQDRLVTGRRQTSRELGELLESFTPGKS